MKHSPYDPARPMLGIITHPHESKRPFQTPTPITRTFSTGTHYFCSQVLLLYLYNFPSIFCNFGIGSNKYMIYKEKMTSNVIPKSLPIPIFSRVC